MGKQGGASYGPDGQSAHIPCRTWGLAPEARDCEVTYILLASGNVNACMNLLQRHHLDLLGLAYCSALRGVVQVRFSLNTEELTPTGVNILIGLNVKQNSLID